MKETKNFYVVGKEERETNNTEAEKFIERMLDGFFIPPKHVEPQECKIRVFITLSAIAQLLSDAIKAGYREFYSILGDVDDLEKFLVNDIYEKSPEWDKSIVDGQKALEFRCVSLLLDSLECLLSSLTDLSVFMAFK